MRNIIDPHIHLFDLQKGNYHWLKAENPPFWEDKKRIQQNFGLADLALSQSLKLQGVVHIEAGFDNQCGAHELVWLENDIFLVGKETKFKTIGYLDFKNPPKTLGNSLELMGKYGSFVGVRCIFDENDYHSLNAALVAKNLELCSKLGLIFELQIDFNEAKEFAFWLKILKQLPNLSVVINHAGFAPFLQFRKDNLLSNTEFSNRQSPSSNIWLLNMIEVAKLSNCFVKCSGFEMVHRQYNKDDMKNVIQQLINIFGVNRVMMASNFPLTLFSQAYQEYWLTVVELCQHLNMTENSTNALLYENAREFYRFNE